jgi:hypothetical protein
VGSEVRQAVAPRQARGAVNPYCKVFRRELNPLKVKLDRKYLIEFNKEETFKLLRGSLGSRAYVSRRRKLWRNLNGVRPLQRQSPIT